MQDITSEEFYDVARKQNSSKKGRPLSPEAIKLQELDIGAGFVVPCTWTHFKYRCLGMNTMHVRAKRRGMRITARCWEKNLYVLRLS